MSEDKSPSPHVPSPESAPPATRRRWLRWDYMAAVGLTILNAVIIGVFVVDADEEAGSAEPSDDLESGLADGHADESEGSAEIAGESPQSGESPQNADAIDAVVRVQGDAIVSFEHHEAAPKAKASPAKYSSVEQAAERSCSTLSVKGLSRQIIAQGRCINPDAFVSLPKRKNLIVQDEVFGVMQSSAQRHLTQALDDNQHLTLTLNSALRTLAQQYLVWRWGDKKRCGVQLAARPGTSNHERGIAIDVREHQAWRKALQAQQFKWMGQSDRVHFDFVGSAKRTTHSADVLAFQKLWNLNHPKERLRETGVFDAATQKRLAESPPGGFPKGASCGG